MCEQGNHDTKVCPWIYSRCKHVPCNGVRALLQSTTNENYGKMFLKCTIPSCNYFEWFEDASNHCKSKLVLLPSNKSCQACGEDDHCIESCPLHHQLCFSSNCNSRMYLKICINQHNKGITYLTCQKCDAFRWETDCIFLAAKEKVRDSTQQMIDLVTKLGKGLNM